MLHQIDLDRTFYSERAIFWKKSILYYIRRLILETIILFTDQSLAGLSENALRLGEGNSSLNVILLF